MKGQIINKAVEIGELGERKNAAYGDSAAKYHDFLSLLWPKGVPPASYRDAGLALRVFDKLMRVATNNDPAGENPWDDAAGYALIGATEPPAAAAEPKRGYAAVRDAEGRCIFCGDVEDPRGYLCCNYMRACRQAASGMKEGGR